LSGGQKQRVALARALAKMPKLLLLDEPLAALDLKLRKEMQVEVKNLQERLGTTFVFVTHDQDEALVMSDRIAVLNEGRIEQIGGPEEIYQRPRTRFVAEFLAVRNVLQARVEETSAGSVRLRTGGGLEVVAADDGGFAKDGPQWVGFRPERLRLGPPGSGPAGTLDDEIYRGDHTEWRVRIGGEVIAVTEDASAASARRRGDAVSLQVPPDAVLRLDP
jgi:ABC-type Fe3+/spermidine/putrescine transport system ATPase subunit